MFKKALIALMAVLMMASVAPAMELEGVNVPETLKAGDKLLVLNGAGVRQAFFNDVYVGGLWLESGNKDGNEISKAEKSMAIRIHVLNDFFASSKHISDAFKKGFRFALPRGDISPVKAELDRLLAAFSDEIKDHEEFDLIYIPGKGTSIIKDGVLKDTIPGNEFKRLLFGIWVSDKATVNEDLKEGMLAGKVSPEALAAKQQWIASVKVEKEKMMADANAAKAKAEAEAKAEADAKAAAMKKAADEAKAKALKMAEATKAAEARAKKAAAAHAAKATAAVHAAKEVKAVSTGVTKITKKQFINDDVYFAKNSAALSNQAKKTLKLKASWLKANPDVSPSIEVSCDSRGSREYNFKLAQRRAKSVVKFMINAGVDSTRMYMVILGSDNAPANAPQNEATWAKSRKAHFVIR